MSVIETLKEKIAKSDETIQVHMYDNGFMVEVGGRDHNDEWATAKICCSSLDEAISVVKTVAQEIPRN